MAIALWLLPILALGAYFGWHHSYTQMAWFSLKLRCLRLGRLRGFTLCLSGAVNHFGWLSPTQMIDGLAHCETTPGPLIMVVAFVGF